MHGKDLPEKVLWPEMMDIRETVSVAIDALRANKLRAILTSLGVIIGSASITIATFAVAMVVMLAVNAIGMLRLPAEMETYGMDLHEHGISAYPEYVISALGAPSGMTQELPAALAKPSLATAKPLSHVAS